MGTFTAFVRDEPTTLGQLAERNTQKFGKYELDKKNREQNKGKNVDKNDQLWYHKNGKASQDEVLDIYKMRRQEMFKGPSDPAIYDTFSAYHLYMTVPIDQDRPPDDIIYTDDNQMIISGPGGIDQSEIETR